MRYIVSILLITFFHSSNVDAQRASLSGGDTIPQENGSGYGGIKPEIIYYTSDNVKLRGYVYKPNGKGPFPVYIWNHGSEKSPDYDKKLGSFWAEKGYVFFKPIRSGHLNNPGIYICDAENRIRHTKEMEQVQFRQIYALHRKVNDDVIAALKWIKKQPYADSNHVVVAGGGYGGIQVLLTAARDGQSSLGIKCFIAMAPASTIWYNAWADSLTEAVSVAKKPIFLLQAKNDYNLGPCEDLCPVIEKKGTPNKCETFPAHTMPGGNILDHKQGHGEFSGDPEAWGEEVLGYLRKCGVKGKK